MISPAAWKIIKPIGAGLAIAYLATAFVDGPPPVHFQPDNPYEAKQTEIVETQSAIVIEKNILKLGSLLSVPKGDIVVPRSNEFSGDRIEVLPPLEPANTVKGIVTDSPEP